MNISLIGATGFIGKNIAYTLRANGFNVNCLVRKESKKNNTQFLLDMGCNLILGNIMDKKSLKDLIKNTDIIINASGQLGGFGKSYQDFHDAHIKGVDNIIDVASRYQKIIHISTAGVVGTALDGDESTVPHPLNKYEKTKLKSEQIVRTHSDYVILRPEFVYGPHDMHLLQLFKSIKKNQFRIIGDGNNMVHPTYIGDLTNVILKVIDNKVKNEIFIVAGERALSLRDYYSLVVGKLGVKPNKIKIPRSLAMFCAEIIEVLANSLKFNPILTKDRVIFFTNSLSFKTDKIVKMLGYVPEPLSVSLDKTFEWYREKRLL